MDENRRQARIAVDLKVTLVSVLDTREGRIIDLSEGGAQIIGASFPAGTRFQIDHRDQTIYARVMWDEVDRMGVRFEYLLTSRSVVRCNAGRPDRRPAGAAVHWRRRPRIRPSRVWPPRRLSHERQRS